MAMKWTRPAKEREMEVKTNVQNRIMRRELGEGKGRDARLHRVMPFDGHKNNKMPSPRHKINVRTHGKGLSEWSRDLRTEGKGNK